MTIQKELCPICGEGQLTAQIDKNPVEYGSQSTLLDAHYSVCDACGSEQASAAQTRANKRAMVAFRKQVDGLLTGAEVRTLRESLRISQAEAARIFGGGPVAFSKYEADDVAQSEAMDKLLRLAAAVPAALEYLQQAAGTEPDLFDLWAVAEMERPQAHPTLRIVSASQPTCEKGWRKTA